MWGEKGEFFLCVCGVIGSKRLRDGVQMGGESQEKGLTEAVSVPYH